MSKIKLHGEEFILKDHQYIWDGVRLIIKDKYRGNENNKRYIIPPKHYGKIFSLECIILPYGKNKIIVPQDEAGGLYE